MTPDRLTDSLGRSWQTGATLARGTWGRSRIVRDPTGREAVLKVPLGREDFPADANVPDELVRACARVAREQAELMQEAAVQPGGAAVQTPRLEATVDLGDGRVGLLLPRYTTLPRKLEAGWPVAEALKLVQRVAATLAETHKVHGNLKPSNVLFGERGEIYLADPCTPALAAHVAELARYAGAGAWLPPATRPATQGADTWALCQVLWASLMDLATAPDGVDKLEVATARDRAHARLGSEGSNPRFRGRVSERLGALLSRGLSHDSEPSPPYRFASTRELADRTGEVLALVRPKVVDVGRLLPPSTAPDGVFVADGPVKFTVTVGCTPGVSDPEDLVCGLQLVDLDAPGEGRVPVGDAGLDVQVHPSGRLRYALELSGVRPGRYRLRVAFAVKDSGDEPQVVHGEVQVRPPPGYVPPPAEPSAPSALPFPGARQDARTTPTGRPGGPAPVPLAAVGPPSGPDEEPLTDPDEVDTPATPMRAAAPPRPAPVHTSSAPHRADDPEPDEDRTFPRPVAPPDEPEPEPVPLPARPRAPSSPPLSTPQVSPGAHLPTPALRAIAPPQPEDGALDTEELLADTDEDEMEISAPRPVSLTPLGAGAGAGVAGAAPWSGGAEGEDDLPGELDGAEMGGRRRVLPPQLAAMLEILRRDRYLSVGVAVATSLFLVLLLTLLVKAC